MTPRITTLLTRAVLLALLTCASLSGVASAANVASSPAIDLPAVIIQFNAASGDLTVPTPAEQALLTREGATAPYSSLGEPGLFRVIVRPGFSPAGVAAALQLNAGVAYAEPDAPFDLGGAVAAYDAATTSGSAESAWALDAIHATEAWKLGDGDGVVVAVLDTGVSPTHPDLRGRLLPGWNFIANNSDISDDDGHGTFVAGLIAASTDAGPEGVAPGASILPIKILDNHGVGSTASFIAGINYAVDHGARVINISASGASDSTALNDALANAEAHNVVVVGSSGNDGTETSVYPASIPSVLAVSATNKLNELAAFSSYGPYVDVAAPGVGISSTWWSPTNGDGHTTASGSSASAPLVSGLAAIVAQLDPGASAANIREIITESARDVGNVGIDAETGFGLIDAAIAARLADPPSAPGISEIQASPNDDTQLVFNAGGFQPGEPVDVWTSSSAGYHVVRGVSADSSGSISVELGTTWSFPSGDLQAFSTGTDSGHAMTANFNVSEQPVADPFKPVQAIESTPDRTYFASTGHTLAFGFKRFWENHGGLQMFGYPISEEFRERDAVTGTTHTVQYFERFRFEYHPEYAGTPFEVSLGLVGAQIAPQVFPTAPPTNTPNLYFADTQHTLTGPFRAYWEANGGVDTFGYPISEPFEQGGTLVQYFERARFEFHPNLPPGSQVLLSRLGVQLARERGYLH